jgi:hypothetical protein
MTEDDKSTAKPGPKSGGARRSGAASGAIPGADLMASFWQMLEDMPKFPLDMTRGMAPVGGTKVADDAARIANRFVEFGQDRYKADMDFLTELAHCKSPEEVMSLQKDWFETAVRDYQENNAALMEAGMRLFNDSLSAGEDAAAGAKRKD